MAARHEEGGYEKSITEHFHACKGLSNDGVGATRRRVFQEIRPGAGFKTGDFVTEKLVGGYRRTTQTIASMIGAAVLANKTFERWSFLTPHRRNTLTIVGTTSLQ